VRKKEETATEMMKMMKISRKENRKAVKRRGRQSVKRRILGYYLGESCNQFS